MKSFFLFLLFSNSSVYCQNGFDVIRKAEKKIEQGNYSKAMKLLCKADSMSFGFCGNAWWEARESITLNKCKIYTVKGESLKAANTLNNTVFNMIVSENIDSLKMVYFLKSIDNQIIKQQLDSVISLITSINPEWFLSGFSLPVNFSEKPFYLSYDTMRSIRRETYIESEQNKYLTELERFKLAIKKQDFYQLLL